MQGIKKSEIYFKEWTHFFLKDKLLKYVKLNVLEA